MKTTIKSFIVICALGIVSMSNVQGSVNRELSNSESARTHQMLAEMSGKLAWLETTNNESIDYQKEAQLVTKWIADMAEAKVTQQVIDRNAPTGSEDHFLKSVKAAVDGVDAITDFRKEAQLVTRAMADKAEASAIQKLIDEGKISENR